MDLTIYDLKSIKTSCENLTTVIDNLLKTKYQNNSDKPFNSLLFKINIHILLFLRIYVYK